MPRGIPAPIKAELNKTGLNVPIFCVKIIISPSVVLRYADGQISFDLGDGAGTATYAARLQDISSIDFAIDQSSQVQFTFANPDRVFTGLDRQYDFLGARILFYGYEKVTGSAYLIWSGWCDNFSSTSPDGAVLPAFPTVATPNVQIPKTKCGQNCQNTFGNFANWNTARDFDGSGCPYQRVSTIGFTANLSGAMDGTTDPITFTAAWTSAMDAAGALLKVGEYVEIGSEIFLLTAAGAMSSHTQSITAARAKKGTAKATHADNSVIKFQDCTYSPDGCTRRGMYGNNPNDTYTIPTYGGTAKRNYYDGYPYLSGWEFGKFRSRSGEKSHPQRVVFSGNDGSSGRALPIVYGRARVADPILLLAKPEGDFLTTLWAVSEGVLGTNPADDTQSGSGYTRNSAYSSTLTPNKGALVEVENVYVNGKSRHDLTPGYGIEIINGDQDEGPPAPIFFPAGDLSDFSTNYLAFWGTARLCLRISQKDNPSVDLNSGQVSGSMEVQWGKVHRVYSDISTYVRRATDDGVYSGANPAWVILDLLCGKRFGGGLDYSRINIQSFLDVAAYCSELITDTFFGGSVKRWTFNGVIDQRKSLQEWLRLICQSYYIQPPYEDANGLIKIRALKSEDLSSVPLFSSKVADGSTRNIVWNGNKSSLQRLHNSVTDVPNEVQANWVDKSHDPNQAAVLVGNLNSTSDPIIVKVQWLAAQVAAGIRFRKDDKFQIDSEIFWITLDPGAPDGSHQQTCHCQRAYNSTAKAAHANGSVVQFWSSAYGKIAITVSVRDQQTQFGVSLGDQTLRVFPKIIDLPGITTYDESARSATLTARAGEFAQGGAANNLQVEYDTFYRDIEDVEVGDPVELEDDELDPVTERYFRVIKMSSIQYRLEDGSLALGRRVRAALHDNAIYDDTALTVTNFQRIDSGGGNDVAPDPVTDFAVAENGIYDGNNKPSTTLQFTYTTPSPQGNFGSLLIFKSRDDGSGSGGSTANPGNPVKDWHYITELFSSGQAIQYSIGQPPVYEWFVAVSRPYSGHTPDINAVNPDGSDRYPRVAVLVDGITDTLPAPSSPAIFIGSNLVALTWQPYTGNNLKLFKHFHVYRNTVNAFGSATLIGTLDGTLYIDTSVAASTTYYYWIVGLSLLNQEGTPTSALSTTSPASSGVDAGVPAAPIIGTIEYPDSPANTGRYAWLITIDPGPTNQNSIDTVRVQVSTDPTFVAFPADASLDRTIIGHPSEDVLFMTNTQGVYYIRAQTHNSFGDSAWAGTLTRDTNALNKTKDTAIPSAPAVSLFSQADLPQLAGNEIQVSFEMPTSNDESAYAYSGIVHSGSILPTATTYYNSFAHVGVSGTLTPGSNVLQVVGSPGFTVNDFAGKEIVLFANSRAGSPSFDYEGQMFIETVTANSGNAITIDIDPQRMFWDQANLGFYIVIPNVGNHFWEKVKFSTPLEYFPSTQAITQDKSNKNVSFAIRTTLATVYVWVTVYNLYGASPVTASPPSKAVPLMTSADLAADSVGTVQLIASSVTETEIADDSISTPKLKTNSVTALKIDVNDLFAQTITATGSITGATLRTSSSSSASRVVIDSTNGLRAFNGSTLRSQIAISGSQPGDIYAESIFGLTNGILLVSNNGASSLQVSSAGITIGGPSVSIGSSLLVSNDITSAGGDFKATSGSFRCSSGQGVGTATDAWAFLSAASIQGFVNSVQRIKIDTTSSPTATPLWLYYNGTMTQVQVFDDGAGHNILYF